MFFFYCFCSFFRVFQAQKCIPTMTIDESLYRFFLLLFFFLSENGHCTTILFNTSPWNHGCDWYVTLYWDPMNHHFVICQFVIYLLFLSKVVCVEHSIDTNQTSGWLQVCPGVTMCEQVFCWWCAAEDTKKEKQRNMHTIWL